MSGVRLGLRENLGQFALLVVVNAFVGAMVGMERTILPSIAEQELHLAAKAAVLSFIVVFGVTKALINYLAGRLSDRFGRKHVLVAGWIVAVPVPFLLMWAPSWSWILFANALLGVSQGLTWSTTVIMKIDLAGPEKRGLAMGLNEFAGYFAVAGSAFATGLVAARYGLRPEPFYMGIGFVAIGLLLSVFVVRETKHHAAQEAKLTSTSPERPLSAREVFVHTSFKDRDLASISQAGLVNNLNDGMAWGLFPLVYAAAGMSLAEIGTLAALYPAVWGLGQLVTGAWSDRVGRKRLIVGQGLAGVCHRCHRLRRRVPRIRGRRRPDRPRDRDGLSDPAGRDRRRGPPFLACLRGRGVSPLARQRIRDRGAPGRGPRRLVWPRGRDARRRGLEPRLRLRGRDPHARDPPTPGPRGHSLDRPMQGARSRSADRAPCRWQRAPLRLAG